MVLACILQCQAYGIIKREVQEKEENLPIKLKIAIDDNVAEEGKELPNFMSKPPGSDLILEIFIKNLGNMSPNDLNSAFKTFLKLITETKN